MQSSIPEYETTTYTASRHVSKILTSTLMIVSGGFLVVLAILAVAGPIILQGAEYQISSSTLFPPSVDNWLGTDELGRSVVAQLVLGSQTSLLVGIVAAASATILGIVIGAISGFGGRRVDAFMMRITEVFQVMPSFVLAAVIVAMWGPGTTRIIVVIAILSWPQTARLMRSEVLRVKEYGFVDSARCLGLQERYILWREIVPNALAPVITLGTLIIGQAILLEAGLAFFGLTSPDVASWGKMLNSGQRYFYQAWWLSVFPGVAIFLTVLAFNLVGDKLADIFNPRSEQ